MGGEMPLDPLTIVVVGLTATAAMSYLHWLAARFGIVKGTLIHAIGSFFIPEPRKSLLLGGILHFLAGIAFAAMYAFIFSFVNPDALRSFAVFGGGLGLVHGYFLSFFLMLGFSGYHPEARFREFDARAALVHMATHIVYGAFVGLGLGMQAIRGTVVWYALYSVLGLTALTAAALVLVPVKPAEPSGSGNQPPRQPVRS